MSEQPEPTEFERPWEPEPDSDGDDWDGVPPETCWHCFGEGGFHDCGEDCCPCADPELNVICEECNGTGRL